MAGACSRPEGALGSDGVDTILVATDGGVGAWGATAVGIDLARQHDADVHALYVVRQASALGHLDPVVERREEAGERAVEAVAERARAHGVPVTKAFRYGTPHEAIGAYAADHGVDLIVVGAPSATGLRRIARPRSVTTRLVEDAPCPVIVARDDDRVDHRAHDGVGHASSTVSE